MSDRNEKDVLRHILSASATLLGFCFVLLSFIKTGGMADKTYIDEIAGIGIMFFLASCIFSYASMRSQKNALRYEKIADIIFLVGLVFLTLVTIILVFEIIH